MVYWRVDTKSKKAIISLKCLIYNLTLEAQVDTVSITRLKKCLVGAESVHVVLLIEIKEKQVDTPRRLRDDRNDDLRLKDKI